MAIVVWEDVVIKRLLKGGLGRYVLYILDRDRSEFRYIIAGFDRIALVMFSGVLFQ